MQEALADADRYLLEYFYAFTEELLERPDPDGGIAEVFAAERLLMRFPTSVITDLLQSAGEPILPSSRPETLVWIAVDDGRRELLGVDSSLELVNLLREEAARRGVRVLLPVLDLEESMTVTPETVWRYDEDPLYDAADRYGAETLLMARLFVGSTGEWVGDWRYDLAGNPISGNTRAESPREVLAFIVDQMAELQSMHYAVFRTEGESEVLHLRIANVSSFDTYMALSRYLNGLTAVRQATISQLDGALVEFVIYPNADVPALRREISMGRQLLPLDDGEEGLLRYQWHAGSSSH